MRVAVHSKKDAHTPTHIYPSPHTVSSHHLADHHHIGTQILVDPKDVQQPDVPIDDVDAVDDPAVAHERWLLETQNHANGEYEDGHEICDVPVLATAKLVFQKSKIPFTHLSVSCSLFLQLSMESQQVLANLPEQSFLSASSSIENILLSIDLFGVRFPVGE